MNKTTNDMASSAKVAKDPFGWKDRKVREQKIDGGQKSFQFFSFMFG